MNSRRIIFRLLILALVISSFGCGRQSSERANLNRLYDYRITRNIVRLMLDAADLVREKGADAFVEFRDKPDKWVYRHAYIYVYNTNGVNLFHGGMPDLEGRHLKHLRDAAGRNMLHLALNAVSDTNNPHAWVHYWWIIPNHLYPVWKSSCHQLVALPQGEKVLVGVGMPNLPRERFFVKSVVDSAADLIHKQGAAAFKHIEDPIGQYNLPGSSVFVISQKGETFIAPGFQTRDSRYILDYIDDAGHKPLQDALKRLKDSNSTWVVMIIRDPDSMNMKKEGLYVHKTVMDSNTVYVAATAALPKPAWMD